MLILGYSVLGGEEILRMSAQIQHHDRSRVMNFSPLTYRQYSILSAMQRYSRDQLTEVALVIPIERMVTTDGSIVHHVSDPMNTDFMFFRKVLQTMQDGFFSIWI